MNCENASIYEYTLPKNYFKFNEKRKIIESFKYKIYEKENWDDIEEIINPKIKIDNSGKFIQTKTGVFWKSNKS